MKRKLSHKQIASLGGKALKEKYPIEVRREWAKKASKARWAKAKTT